MTERTLTTAIAFFDRTDPNNEGWAYRLRFDNGDEESGPMDQTDPEDSSVWDDLVTLIETYGGIVSPGSIVAHAEDGDSLVWEW